MKNEEQYQNKTIIKYFSLNTFWLLLLSEEYR